MTIDKIPVKITRKEFLTLPMETRRRILSEQVEEMLKDHSEVGKTVEELTKTGFGKPVKIHYLSLTRPELVRATIRRQKTETRRVIVKQNSSIGEGGDWDKLDFAGKTVHKETMGGIEMEKKAPLPFRDEGFGDHTYQYLHVPYDWAEDETIYRVYPRWQPGEIIGIKESWGVSDYSQKFPGKLQVIYKAGVSDINHPEGNTTDRLWRDVDEATWRFYASKNQMRGPRFMPAWAVRLWAQVESVRPERVQDITEEGALAEGILKSENTGRYIPGNCDYATWAYEILWDTINAPLGKGWDTNPWVWVLKYRLLTSTGLQAVQVPQFTGAPFLSIHNG
jgi:hypothetical protein